MRANRFWRMAFGFLLAAISVTTFGATFVVSQVLTRSDCISPIVLVIMRFAIAGGMIAMFACRTPKSARNLITIEKRDLNTICWLGPIGTGFMALMVFMGCARVSTANASMADALTPLFVFVATVAMTRRITWLQTAGVICGFTGVLMVVGVISGEGIKLEAYSIGDLFIALSAASWALYTVCGGEPVRRMGVEKFSTWTMSAGAVAFALVAAICMVVGVELGWPNTLGAWGRVAILGVVCTLVPFVCWNAAQKYLPVMVLGVCAFFTPIASMLLAKAFLGETSSLLQWIGVAMVCASAVVETSRE